MRHQIAGEIVELDHGRAAQQLGEQQLAAFLVIGREGGRCAALRRGKGGDQLAQIGLARPHHVRPHMKHRRRRQAGADGSGKDGGQRCRAIRLARETELGQQVLKQRQRCFRHRAAGCVHEGKRARVEHAEHARGGIVAGRRHQAAVGSQIGLACQAAEHWQMLVTRRIEQHRRMPCRGIGAHPILRAGVVAFPQRGPRERAHQRRLRDILNPRFARAGIGHHRDDQSATLIADMPLGTMPMQTLEAAEAVSGFMLTAQAAGSRDNARPGQKSALAVRRLPKAQSLDAALSRDGAGRGLAAIAGGTAVESRRWRHGDSAEMTTATRWWPLGCSINVPIRQVVSPRLPPFDGRLAP